MAIGKVMQIILHNQAVCDQQEASAVHTVKLFYRHDKLSSYVNLVQSYANGSFAESNHAGPDGEVPIVASELAVLAEFALLGILDATRKAADSGDLDICRTSGE